MSGKIHPPRPGLLIVIPLTPSPPPGVNFSYELINPHFKVRILFEKAIVKEVAIVENVW